MTTYIDSVELATEVCCNCSMVFAIPSDFKRRRVDDHAYFFCPAGHQQRYTGPTEAMKLRRELERKQEMLNAEQARAATLALERDQTARAHNRMRNRIQNGVCPCCNRTFQNLLMHMRTEHADKPTVKTLREAFGMTQTALAKEIGIKHAYVSLIENERPAPAYAQKLVKQWLETQGVKP